MDLQIVHAVQSIATPTLDFFMRVFTAFGEQTFFLLLFAITYWCINKNSALKMTFAFLLSVCVNGLKSIVKRERPHVADPTVNGPHVSSDYSFPSGHSQNYAVTATSFGFALFEVAKKKWQRVVYVVVAVVMGLLMGLSRIYWGMHYLTDVAAGLALGTLCALVVEVVVKFMPAKLKQFGLTRLLLIGIGVAVTALVVLICVGIKSAGVYKDVALFIGVAGGHVVNERFVKYDPKTTRVNKWIVVAIGLVVCGGAYALLRLIPNNTVSLSLAFFAVTALATAFVPFVVKLIEKRFYTNKN